MAIALDLLFLIAGWAAAQILFNGYEAHVSRARRLLELLVLIGIFSGIRVGLGRRAFYALLALMSAGMAILHGYWFHYRHGIHWRTAEPREKYLRLIGEGDTKNT